ncbi:MAG TPA: DUF4339 domain-containing protein [Isosphaeraceae bacterium]|nr:DUF4339 domain-containing protein [Isosphaeraceae bacterium]
MMEDERWYVRSRGLITGPFSLAQLDSLRKRGVLARFHEVSNDRANWSKASTLTSVFPDPNVARRDAPAGARQAHQVEENDKIVIVVEDIDSAKASFPVAGAESQPWYYVVNGERAGPVSFSELQHATESNRVGPDDLVWTEGLIAWITARDTPGLSFFRPVTTQPNASGSASSSNDPALAQPPANALRISRLAVASLVLGLLWLGGLGSLLALIFGATALNQIHQSPGTLRGAGLAQAGLTLGILGLLAGLLYALSMLISLPGQLHG